MEAKIGTVVSTSTRPTTLPRYIEAIRPQTKSLCSTNSSGPGLRPHTIKPPSRIAAVPEACTAVSGANTPSMRPFKTVLVLGEALGEVVAHEGRGDGATRGDAE